MVEEKSQIVPEQSERLKYCFACGSSIDSRSEICVKCGVRQYTPNPKKSKTLTAFLALFLGGFGIHKFYLGRSGQGILYLIFSWTFFPYLIGFCESIMFFTMKEEKFDAEYCTDPALKPALNPKKEEKIIDTDERAQTNIRADAFVKFMKVLMISAFGALIVAVLFNALPKSDINKSIEGLKRSFGNVARSISPTNL